MPTRALSPASPDESDERLLVRIGEADHRAFETLMRRHNARLFRVARAILRDDESAEDVLQEAYLDAYRRVGTFRGQASVATWLTKIVINRALMHLRKHRRDRVVVPFDGHTSNEKPMESHMADDRIESPSDATLRAEVRRLIEHRLDDLPVAFRTVFVLREVEDLSVDETAACLDIPPATVRSRLFRARTLLRAALTQDLDHATTNIFRFDGTRCDRIVSRVLDRVSQSAPATRP
ncbi:MAG: RNA polymerase sigma factor [Acidobacteriota bacterium]